MTEIETASERGNTSRGRGRGRSRLIVEEPDVGLDPITLSRRQALNRSTTQAPLNEYFQGRFSQDFTRALDYAMSIS